MARLKSSERAKLPDSAFAYVDSRGRRRLPIHDQSHVRNALARFDQVDYETEADREKARTRLLRAAKKYGILPIGFIETQLRSERAAPREPGTLMMPSGFVTLLLTDIEASTRHLRRLGDQYEELLGRVRRIARQTVGAAGGVEVEVRADETFSMFEDAAAGVMAAVEMQRTMASTTWPDGVDVRIRVGLHSGDVRLTSNGYIGLAIHKADRVRGLAGGGQIICSAETRNAARRTLPDGIGYLPLGRHELAGLPKTHPLYQPTSEGLDFPAPETPADR